jgi:hypothetical protein
MKINKSVLFLLAITLLLTGIVILIWNERATPFLKNKLTLAFKEIFHSSGIHNHIIFYGRDHYTIEGTAFDASVKEDDFDRLPYDYKNLVRPVLWKWSKCSSGMTVNFSTNSTSVKVRWILITNRHFQHMSPTGINGVDLYCKQNGEWKYINTGKPQALFNEQMLTENMASQWREYKLYLPLYNGVSRLELGIDSGAAIIKAEKELSKPIVFYGTSMTQGACVSRPGMNYVNLLSRRLKIPCLNFGFDRNGLMEPEIVKMISAIDAQLYYIDCTINMDSEQIVDRMLPLVSILRQTRPFVPIVFAEAVISTTAEYNSSVGAFEVGLNQALHAGYEDLCSKGYKYIYYISSPELDSTSHETTVDGTHFNDHGAALMAQYLEKEIRTILEMQRHDNGNFISGMVKYLQ